MRFQHASAEKAHYNQRLPCKPSFHSISFSSRFSIIDELNIPYLVAPGLVIDRDPVEFTSSLAGQSTEVRPR